MWPSYISCETQKFQEQRIEIWASLSFLSATCSSLLKTCNFLPSPTPTTRTTTKPPPLELPTYRGLWEVHGLKDETHNGRHLDDLSAHQAKLLVVIQHCVHVLYPHGVYRSVEDDPFAVGRVGHRELTERVGRHSVRPLTMNNQSTNQPTNQHLIIKVKGVYREFFTETRFGTKERYPPYAVA